MSPGDPTPGKHDVDLCGNHFLACLCGQPPAFAAQNSVLALPGWLLFVHYVNEPCCCVPLSPGCWSPQLSTVTHCCPAVFHCMNRIPWIYPLTTHGTSVLRGHEAMNVISGQATWCLRKGYLVRSLFLFVFDNGSFRILTRKVQ